MKHLLPLACLCIAAAPAFAANSLLLRLAASPAAMAACGPQTARISRKSIPTPRIRSGPAPGKALVYFFSNAAQAGSPRVVQIGVDGKWVGAAKDASFVAVEVAPARHHFCSSLYQRFSGTEIALNSLDAQAGKTYYFTTLILNDWRGGYKYSLDRTDPAEAELLLQRARIQAAVNSPPLPKGFGRRIHATLRRGVLVAQQVSQTPPASEACGPRMTRFTVSTDRRRAVPAEPSANRALVYFVLNSVGSVLPFSHGGPVVNIGLDGSWVGALQDRSYLPIEVAPGRHLVCFERVFTRAIPGAGFMSQVQIRRLNAEAGKTYFFHARTLLPIDGGDDVGPPALVVTPLNAAEGGLLVETSALSVPQEKPGK